MADDLLFIGWDEVVRGREERAIEAFNETVGYYGRLQQEGRIESLNAVFLQPNGSGLQGYFELRGDAAQLGAIQQEEEFQRNLINASLVVDGLRMIAGVTNNGIAEQMALYQDAIAKVAQTT